DGIVRERVFYDFANAREMGLSAQDMVAPASIQYYPRHIRIGRKYVRVMQIVTLPNALSDEFFMRLTDVNFNMVTTINIRPIQSKVANAMVHKNIVLAQTRKSDEMKNLIAAGLPEEMVSPETEERVERALALRSDMINDDEKLYKVTYTLMFYANTEEQLQEYTDTIYANCNASVVGIRIMVDRQEEGFNTTLPLLYVDIPFHKRRTLKSSSVTAVCMPFSYLELRDPGGINYSLHLISKNLILYNRLLTQNFNGFILGTPGSGKSFAAKLEILLILLVTLSVCIVLDPEREYVALAKLLGGEVIKITPGGKWHINPMEITVDYEWTNEDDTTETNPVLAKADFILKLMDVLVKEELSSVQETIIDECVHDLYAPFMDEDGRLHPIPPEEMPTLTDLQQVLEERPEEDAYVLSQALKLYTGTGSLNTFGFQSNVDTRNRFVVYDIKDIGEKLKPVAMLIILDSIMNRMFENRREGRNTWFWVDEIYLLFSDERSASFLNMLFKRARKYGGVPTGITQNVEDLLESDTARKMLSNCNFVQMLNQAPNDRLQLAQLLNLSESQIDVITSAPRGQGLIYTGTNCVPFSSTFPKYTKDGEVHPIYRVLTSNMKELKEYEEEDRRREAAMQREEKMRELRDSQEGNRE
ncbi:MAG: DUF87 domain-containing protein, partial [Lachnospiraceae bacterium]|nr:DUF87 domain-containing protein [Lachnospiraceae bacterium]